MTGFSPDWLRLREPADLAARDASVRARVLGYVNATDKVVVADLAAGTGSTARALSAGITVPQEWHLVDNDETLLQKAASVLCEPGREHFSVATHCLDLKRFPAGIPAIAPNLITASAFVDLVSLDWLSRLVTYALMERIPVYAALTYDGAVEFSPRDPGDDEIVQAVNRHQTGDKGFGPALGPGAADRIEKLFKVARFETVKSPSDWSLDDDHPELQKEFLAGLAQAAAETRLVEPAVVEAWLRRRVELVEEGNSRIVVGHKDVAAFPR